MALAAAVLRYILSAEPLPVVDVEAGGGALFASAAIRTFASCWLACCVGCGVAGWDRCCKEAMMTVGKAVVLAKAEARVEVPMMVTRY